MLKVYVHVDIVTAEIRYQLATVLYLTLSTSLGPVPLKASLTNIKRLENTLQNVVIKNLFVTKFTFAQLDVTCH